MNGPIRSLYSNASSPPPLPTFRRVLQQGWTGPVALEPRGGRSSIREGFDEAVAVCDPEIVPLQEA